MSILYCCSRLLPHSERQDKDGAIEIWHSLFALPQGDAMLLFIWQDDNFSVVRFLDACIERVYTLAGAPVGDQASDQPQVGWKRRNDLLPFQ